MEACIVGASPSLMWALPSLLSRAGFTVDVIATSGLLRASRFVRGFQRVDTFDELIEAGYRQITSRSTAYDWVIACDDETLRQLNRMDWPEGRRPGHMTRTSGRRVSHIFSKIGLSRRLAEAGVRTPEFRVAGNCREAVEASQELGYPVLLKLDSASGGTGVRACRDDGDILGHEGMFGAGPILVQKKIEGRELDLSAIYFEGKLVHFAYSEVARTRNPFGVSSVRVYHPLPLVEECVFAELMALGRALDADGFASISCIEAADGSGRYYFEADMRPNAWCDVSRMFGEDAAPRIRSWFMHGKTLCSKDLGSADGVAPVTVPYFLRLNVWELLTNRFRVWRFIAWDDGLVVFCQLCSRVFMPATRALVPWKLRQTVRRGMLRFGVPFP